METIKREILVGETYRHFKGKYYKVLFIANDSESSNAEDPIKIVVYEALYDNHQIWTRNYDMFNSFVDKEKYPEVEQEYRFELVRK